ncbi:MAG: Lrp/AsnC family transcriptional regulator [Altererythrobacter sp.]|nr:Lrp/AsnC family transcriptional regulator [Altererythrobacter sp.]MBT8431953.1 Lrp/AsnC family transcriptional regulator [Altererythrobacter sp.]NNE48731.1 Lrp/AsnC family transcriptional regulator [Altererythrobacter sp.]NNF94022.1 Lrp/AsnC family transcriptional regulator [Altererythrobacter sp.]NNK45551.1 Lrp/AsnC family transcriptional regulator [Altererythrobacter sp.]
MELDSIDHKLLGALGRNGRATHQQLGEEIGRSPTSIARRQRALEDAGLIRGYSADLDMAQLGHGARVHIRITLASQSREQMDAFEEAVKQSPSVTACELMSGSDDYFITVQVRSLDHFAEIHRDELAQLPGVVRMETGFVLRQVVEPRMPPGWAG